MTKPAISTAAQKMAKARAALVIQFPFWGSLALRLQLAECDTIKTADVDGRTMRYNPAFVDGLSIAECAGLVAHEVGHCALGHVWRMAGRDHKRWNKAGDYAINPILVESGCTLPAGALLDRARWPAGTAADEIFAQLADESGGGGKGKPGAGGQAADDGEPGMGEMREPDPAPGNSTVTQTEKDDMARDWSVATIQAANAAKAAGNLPGSLRRLVEDIKAPREDWRARLRRFVQSKFSSDYSWRRPNRRYLHTGLYLPSMIADGIGPIVIFRDTSGSTFDPAIQAAFNAETGAVISDAKPASVHVVDVDTAVCAVTEFEHGQPFDPPPFHGGGGTDFRPAFDWLEQQEISPCCVIYLTDLYGTFPDVPPSVPVLWAVVGNDDTAPFGETIHLDAA